MISAWWISICFDCLQCLKVRCFWTSEFACFHVLALKVFWTFFLKHGKFRCPRWNCSYWASKSRRNTNLGGWKQNVSANILFCSFCSLWPPLFDKQGLDAMVTVWLTSKKNPKSSNSFDNAGRVLSKTTVTENTKVHMKDWVQVPLAGKLIAVAFSLPVFLKLLFQGRRPMVPDLNRYLSFKHSTAQLVKSKSKQNQSGTCEICKRFTFSGNTSTDSVNCMQFD